VVLATVVLGAACTPSLGSPPAREQSESVRGADAPREARGPGGVTVQAEAHVEDSIPKRLVVSARVVNRTARQVRLQYGTGCSLQVLLHRDARGSDRPAWNSAEQRAWVAGQLSPVICIGIGSGADLAPGETQSEKFWTKAYPVAEILGDSLPEGRYSVTAALIFEPAGIRPDTVRVAAGTVVLRR
jgi:hypothetical protein